MRSWSDSTFIFISTNPRHDEGGVEDRWLAVMSELRSKGANVRFLCLMGSPAGERARAEGIEVDPYILDKWNVIRSRSRLRKYFKRYMPVAVHSTGLEADLLTRWAARKVPVVAVVHTLPVDSQATRRKRPIDALFRRFDELGMRRSAAVFVPDDEIAAEVRGAGVDAKRIVLDGVSADVDESVEAHIELYGRLMKERGSG
jgi:hypothetical protein